MRRIISAALKATVATLGVAVAIGVPATAHAATTEAPVGSAWNLSADGSLLVDTGNDLLRVANGGRQTLVTGAVFQRKYGSFSKDGNRIVYSDLGRTGFGAQLWTMKSDGSQKRQLTSLSAEAFGARFSPDGRTVAFQTATSGEAAIWLVNADGTHPRQLSRPGGYYGVGISWAPDGRSLVTTRGTVDERSGEPSGWEVVSVRADGSGETALTHTGGDKNSPAISPDGRKIVFSYTTEAGMRAGTPYELWTMRIDGSGARQLTHTPTVGEQEAVWSPSGTGLAYASWAPSETTPHVVKAKADGTDAQALNTTGYPVSWR